MLVGLMQISEGFSRQENRVSWENRLNTRKKVQLLLSKTVLSPKSKYALDYFEWFLPPLFRAAATVPGRCFWNSISPKQDKGKHFGVLLGNAPKHSLFCFGLQKTRGSRSSVFLKMSNTPFLRPPESVAVRQPVKPPRELPSNLNQYTIHTTRLGFGVLCFFSVLAKTTEVETLKNRYNMIDMRWRNLLKV